MRTEVNQIEKNCHKHLTPEQKLVESLKLYYLARELKRAGLLAFNPGLDNKIIDEKVTEIFLNASS